MTSIVNRIPPSSGDDNEKEAKSEYGNGYKNVNK
jgi:hypothetical protein